MKVLLPIIWHELTHCIRDAWVNAGHEVTVYDWRTEHKRKGKDRAMADLVEMARKMKPDLCWMQIQAPGILTPSVAKALRENCGYLAHWTGDVRHPLPQWYLDIAPHVDCLLFSNGTDVDIMRGMGHPAAHLQIGVDTDLYYPGNEERSGVVFVGNNYTGYKYAESESRRELVAALADEFGEEFRVYGLGWDKNPCSMGYVREPADADILRRSLVAINWDHFHRPWFASDRLLRATACGCDVVSQNYEGIEVEHPWVVGADSIDEVLECVRYILDEGGINGSRNAKNTFDGHTWHDRVPRMIEIMEQYPPEAMSKREPLLSDHEVDLLDIAGAVRTVRDFYERLIDEGKLRVVEEVDVDIPFDSGNCRICHAFVKDGFNYCPGCGGKIKR